MSNLFNQVASFNSYKSERQHKRSDNRLVPRISRSTNSSIDALSNIAQRLTQARSKLNPTPPKNAVAPKNNQKQVLRIPSSLEPRSTASLPEPMHPPRTRHHIAAEEDRSCRKETVSTFLKKGALDRLHAQEVPRKSPKSIPEHHAKNEESKPDAR